MKARGQGQGSGGCQMGVGWMSDRYQMAQGAGPGLRLGGRGVVGSWGRGVIAMPLPLSIPILLPSDAESFVSVDHICSIPIYGHMIIHYTHIWSCDHVLKPCSYPQMRRALSRWTKGLLGAVRCHPYDTHLTPTRHLSDTHLTPI